MAGFAGDAQFVIRPKATSLLIHPSRKNERLEERHVVPIFKPEISSLDQKPE